MENSKIHKIKKIYQETLAKLKELETLQKKIIKDTLKKLEKEKIKELKKELEK